ncbi:hypothetical protein [Streptomyces sp. BBFR109]|uniref:hypothetical protein n=1 Tax=Streptomyces sp. BBFR109 TaxID=3448172 RepID=UPI003F762336
MNHLVAPPTHRDPEDYRGPFEPVRAAVGHRATSWCHRCDDTADPHFVHLVNADDLPLCRRCLQHLNPPLRRGLEALNRLSRVLNQPSAYRGVDLVSEWRWAHRLARPEEAYLLQTAAQLLARHLGYRPPGFRPSEITA